MKFQYFCWGIKKDTQFSKINYCYQHVYFIVFVYNAKIVIRCKTKTPKDTTKTTQKKQKLKIKQKQTQKQTKIIQNGKKE